MGCCAAVAARGIHPPGARLSYRGQVRTWALMNAEEELRSTGLLPCRAAIEAGHGWAIVERHLGLCVPPDPCDEETWADILSVVTCERQLRIEALEAAFHRVAKSLGYQIVPSAEASDRPVSRRVALAGRTVWDRIEFGVDNHCELWVQVGQQRRPARAA